MQQRSESYPEISKSITREQISNECAVVAAGGALLLLAKKTVGVVEFLLHLSNIASGSQKINRSKIGLLFLQILYDYSHVTNNYCKHCP